MHKLFLALLLLSGMTRGFASPDLSPPTDSPEHLHDHVAHVHGMAREASGTSWQPDSTPMDGLHATRGDWTMMFHGFATAFYTDNNGPRGDRDFTIASMLMAMAQRPLGAGALSFRAMGSLDPWLVGKRGYPLLFQTGETADGQHPLIDRQHPHDLFMELSASYSHPLTAATSTFLYAALAGEPALGPTTFMHRFSGLENPEAPLSHHWLDSTHISFGVVTWGVSTQTLRLEASAFNGQEPDEHRGDIETRRLDSWSTRVSFNPTEHWALQTSFGRLKSPEQLEPGVNLDRLTASATYNRPTANGNWQSTVAWGRNAKKPGNRTQAWLAESAWTLRKTHSLFARLEHVDKDELFDHDDPLHGQPFTVDKLTVGYIRDFALGAHNRLGIGVAASRFALPQTLRPVYGEHPNAWLAFLRFKL